MNLFLPVIEELFIKLFIPILLNSFIKKAEKLFPVEKSGVDKKTFVVSEVKEILENNSWAKYFNADELDKLINKKVEELINTI